MSRLSAFAIAFLLVYAPAAGSATSEKTALIQDLMKVIDAEQLIRKSIDKSLEATLGYGDMEGLPPEDRARYESAMQAEAAHRAKVLQRIDVGKYATQLLVPLFERYTVDELKDAIAFYKTPAGQKSAALLPELAAAGNGAMMLMSEEFYAADRAIDDEERSLEPAWKRTMADMRSMATATEAYATDTNEYPQASDLDELAPFLSPTYIRILPKEDGWGHEYTYVPSPDRQHYRFVSSGADGRLDFDSTRLTTLEAELKAQERMTTDPDEDIIYQDGAFVRYPKEAERK